MSDPLVLTIATWLKNPRKTVAQARVRWPTQDLVATLITVDDEPHLELRPVHEGDRG